MLTLCIENILLNQQASCKSAKLKWQQYKQDTYLLHAYRTYKVIFKKYDDLLEEHENV